MAERERTGKAETRAATAETRAKVTAARVTDLQEQLKAAAAREAEATRRAEAAEQHPRDAVQQGVRGHK
jgi:hypothetical protein